MAVVYAAVDDVEARLGRTLSEDERVTCQTMLEDAAVVIDSMARTACGSAKKVVSCRMVMRALAVDPGVPMGANQGSMSGLGYSQSWTISGGSTGELYLTKLDRQLLGAGNAIGSYSPVQEKAGGCL